ncbi:PadR family transcriptional regulator [Paenibacillus sp. FSL W8-0186]|uniref:PadR family transcriptional regulator n=1 Tax=Paenibacillus woosongensis TaxID=307580 RepID=A0A7X2Z4X1_9BACL|nr:PadR family transcriptional regulator [Paenibacillus woosongensis]MUG46916.1 PadR family transcriptional regulator [Paenibacillus woosongensis]GIP58824.1 PadR family transcriptional regulator [Paenibacillus woosongensis]
MTDIQEVVNGLLQELRRGTIIIGVLSQLSEPQYGYSLVMILEEKGMSIDPGTLYPLLRRLEKQGLLDSEWDTTESRPRKYYRRSEFGTEVYRQLCTEWKELNRSVEGLLDLN